MLEILIITLVVLVLVVANGLFVAAEFAILAAPRAAVAARASAGEPAAKTLHAILQDPRRVDRYIATAQVGITFASLGLGMYGEHALAEWLYPRLAWLGVVQAIGAHTVASAVALVLLTYLHIVIGEMIPKALALQHAERTVFRVANPMRIMRRIFAPLVVALNGIGNGILRLMGIRRELSASRYHTADELRAVVEDSQRGGELRQEESRILREALEFSELSAGEAMVPRVRVAGIPLGANPDQVRTIVHAAPHTRYPVYREGLDQIVGVVHVVELLRHARHGRPVTEEDLRRVPYVPESASLDRVLATLRAAKAHLAVVMDEHGGSAGIITIEDLMEELVGDIAESQDAHQLPVREPDGFRVDGGMRLDELAELIGHDIVNEDVDTIGGLVLDVLGRMPRVGDTITHQGVQVRVTRLAGHGVRECVVRVTDPDAR